MKAIITGATGGLGRNLVEFLLAQGWQIIAFGRNKAIGERLGCEFHAFDLSDAAQTQQYFQAADVVFHCAALSSPWGRYEDFYKANVLATANVLHAMKHYEIGKLVHVSTPSIYFDFQPHLQLSEYFLPEQFVNYYAQTKYQAEQLIRASEVDSVILRPRAIFGEYDTVLVPRLEHVAARGFLPLVKNRQVMVDVCYVGNVVHALYLAACTQLPKGATFNITNQQPLPIKQVFTLLMQALNQPVRFKEISYRRLMTYATLLESMAKLGIFHEPPLTRYAVGVISHSQTLDTSKANHILGYQPLYSIEQGVERYARYRNI